jgi:SAM-dependent methyltransferase
MTTESTSWQIIARSLSERFRNQIYEEEGRFQYISGRTGLNSDSFGFVPINCVTLLNLLHLASRQIKRLPYYTKFIDAGCGIGLTLDFAKDMGFKTYGVEHSQKLAAEARSRNHKVFEEDIMKFDFSPYEIVYAYRPLKDSWPQFMLKVSNEAKVGTILISATGEWKVDPNTKDQWEVIKTERSVKLFENLSAIEAGQIIKRIK